jgi:hypothetical protein
VRGFVFDAGAFIALERRAPLLLGILDEALHGTIQIVLPRTVIAQVWRGGPGQANVGRLISAGRGPDGPLPPPERILHAAPLPGSSSKIAATTSDML